MSDTQPPHIRPVDEDGTPVEGGQPQQVKRPGRFHLPVRSLVPNMLTVLALCAGLTAIRFGLSGRFEAAIIAVMIAAVLDGLDGRVARLLNGQTKFGAELDSLTDFVNFGVVPALLLFIWALQGLGGFGWVMSLTYAVCCGLRLARFNVSHDDPNQPDWMNGYFTGVPSPAGAMLVFVPFFAVFMGAEWLLQIPLVIALYTGLIGFLMVSRVPTYSFKRVKVRRDLVLPLLIVVALIAALFATNPWESLLVVAIAYAALMPVSYISFTRRLAKEPGYEPDETPEGPPISLD